MQQMMGQKTFKRPQGGAIMRTVASVEQPRIDTPLSERSGMRDKSPLDHGAVLKSGEYSRSPPPVEATNERIVSKKHARR